MIARPAALLFSTLVLAPSLVLAAPPDGDRPPVQRPSSEDESAESDEAAAPEDAASPEATAAPEGAEAEAPVETEAAPPEGEEGAEAAAGEAEPEAGPAADAAASEAEAEAEAKPAGDDEERLAGLLTSNESEPTRTRTRSQPAERNRVDRSERLRNYYKNIYRPEHNPPRIYFATRAGYALSGVTKNSGGGRMGFANVEVGQTWNHVGYSIGPTIYAGELTFGELGVEKYGGLLFGGGPSVGLGRLSLLGRGYLDFRLGYNFFYAPVSTTRAEFSDPPDAAPHGPKAQIDIGLLLHDSESRRFRHGLGATIGYQGLVHSLAGEYPIVNTFAIGVSYFFG